MYIFALLYLGSFPKNGLPCYFLLHLKLLNHRGKRVRYDQDHDAYPWGGNKFCDESQMQVSEITNEKDEKTWDDVPDVPPAAVGIPRQFDLINEITIIMDVFRAILTT